VATVVFLALVAVGGFAVLVNVAPRSQASRAPLAPPVAVAAEPGAEEVASIQAESDPLPAVPGLDFTPAGTDERGWRLYQIRIKAGGSPNLVAVERLTPLFEVNGQDGPTYVANAFFSQNPHRRPNTIQPGDEFTLAIPPDAFVVRSQEDIVEHLGGTARVRVYQSEQGDQLRYYLTDPFPIVYELQPANSGRATIVFHRELAYQLSSGRTNATRLAQLIYRIPDPDIYQIEATKALVAKATAGENVNLEVDRSRRYLDLMREAMLNAYATEAVAEPDRSHLTRVLFDDPTRAAFAAVEDGLGRATDIAELQNGRVFRIEYAWDGTVRVLYKTGRDDSMGKRNPSLLRENERWAGLYQRLSQSGDWPVRWSAGDPEDLPPFPSARDPRYKAPDEDRAYDYLIPGRVMVLTFKPTRFHAEAQADNAVFGAVLDARERFRDQIEGAFELLDQFGARDLLSPRPKSPHGASAE
jgi:hypothetical protein